MNDRQQDEPGVAAPLINQWGEAVLRAYDRIRVAVRRTPIEEISGLIPDCRARVFAKLEDEQETGSFKLRGATNRILQLTSEEKRQGVVAASNGNHGLGVAAAAKRAGVSAEIYVSRQVAPQKAKRIEKLGARIRQEGSDPLDAEIIGRQRAMESGRVFISPYNDPDVLAGQGTIAVELLEELPRLDAVFAAVGGGGLIGGIGAYLKHASPQTEVVGCWPENSPVLFESMKAGWILPVAEKPTISESTAGGLEEGSITLEVCTAVIDTCVLVSEEEILEAMRLVRRAKGWLIEGAAGVALAAFLKTAHRYEGRTVAIVICGGNLSEKVGGLL
ncbi:MAG TPA: threonine/serine dehydratase [Acidobacteriaceae bacterium]|jgi:threonine dehydratase